MKGTLDQIFGEEDAEEKVEVKEFVVMESLIDDEAEETTENEIRDDSDDTSVEIYEEEISEASTASAEETQTAEEYEASAIVDLDEKSLVESLPTAMFYGANVGVSQFSTTMIEVPETKDPKIHPLLVDPVSWWRNLDLGHCKYRDAAVRRVWQPPWKFSMDSNDNLGDSLSRESEFAEEELVMGEDNGDKEENPDRFDLFCEYFENHGQGTDVVLMYAYDQNTQWTRGFGLTTFDNEDAIMQLIEFFTRPSMA